MVSKSQHIRSLVCGFPARIRKNRCIVVFNGFVDDSGSSRGVYSGNVYVLAGFISTAEKWEEFSDAFEEICDKEPTIADFHMYEAYRPIGKSEYKFKDETERDQRIREMVALIKGKALYRVDSVLAWPNYERIIKGRVPPEIDSPYFLLYYNTILAFASFMEQAKLTGTVDWVFDDQGPVGNEALNWYDFIKDNIGDEVKKYLGAKPIFRHDSDVLPLKAADIFAWQIRKHLATEQPKGIPHNENMDSLLAMHGTSTIIEPDFMQDFVWHIQMNMGLMLKSNALHFTPL